MPLQTLDSNSIPELIQLRGMTLRIPYKILIIHINMYFFVEFWHLFCILTRPGKAQNLAWPYNQVLLYLGLGIGGAAVRRYGGTALWWCKPNKHFYARVSLYIFIFQLKITGKNLYEHTSIITEAPLPDPSITTGIGGASPTRVRKCCFGHSRCQTRYYRDHSSPSCIPLKIRILLTHFYHKTRKALMLEWASL